MSIAPSLLTGVPSATALAERTARTQEASPAFSYALAAAALERRASQSLNAHGARPDAKDDAGVPPQANKTGGAASVVREKTAARVEAASPAPREAAKTVASRTSPATDAFKSQAGAAAAPQFIAAALSSPASAKAADAVAARDSGPVKARLAALKAQRAPAQAPALKTEFAEILARRLEKTSVFDIRLDPPELGRVEGRLSVADDGRSTLALSFDNPDAYDLYSRDAAALRQALIGAGLDFGAGDFVFAFRDRAGPDGGKDAGDDSAARADRLFFAEWSAGALDIRI